LGEPLFYSRINFGDYIDEIFKKSLDIKIEIPGRISGIKITTFTLITENIICGPTPMLNPPLIIPVEKFEVYPGDVVKLDLNYEMGGGLGSVRAGIKKVQRGP